MKQARAFVEQSTPKVATSNNNTCCVSPASTISLHVYVEQSASNLSFRTVTSLTSFPPQMKTFLYGLRVDDHFVDIIFIFIIIIVCLFVCLFVVVLTVVHAVFTNPFCYSTDAQQQLVLKRC